ncbi:MAG: HAMP domain-containing histidine kinase [Elusimicrobia bacterium]|nr:HAMP domain-containing histidine kinase [Elusimicrobiota bacterium]
MLQDVAKQKELQRMQEDFIGNVTHELRSPLTSIKAAMATLDDDSDKTVSPQQQQILTIANKNIDRLARLINDLLDTTKISAGKMAINPKPIQPDSILQDAVASLQSWAKMKQINLIGETVNNLPAVMADVDRITQVLVNFISNAIKFTPAQGKITVRAQPMGNSYLKIFVSDTGPGMSKKEQDHLFEKFYQTKQLSKSDQPGTGLGLFIAKSIVEMHKGQIGLESVEGKGTTFYFTLPVATEPVKETLKDASPSQLESKRGWLSRLFHGK